MRQFEVFRNPSEKSKRFAPSIVAIQSHHISLDTVLVAPLVNDKLATNVEVAINFDGHVLMVALTELGSIRTAALSESVGDLSFYEDDIRRAIDRLFTGF